MRTVRTSMPQFAGFFSDSAGYGFEMVQALNSAHAQYIAIAQHPKGMLSAVLAELALTLGSSEMTDA